MVQGDRADVSASRTAEASGVTTALKKEHRLADGKNRRLQRQYFESRGTRRKLRDGH